MQKKPHYHLVWRLMVALITHPSVMIKIPTAVSVFLAGMLMCLPYTGKRTLETM